LLPSSPPPEVARLPIGGVAISCIDMPGALDALFSIAAARSGGYFAFTCAHGIVDSQKDEALRGILNGSRRTLPDGMPLVWVGRMKGRSLSRVTAPDFFEAAMRDPRARDLRHYFYGASPQTVERIVARAQAMVGPQAIAGWHSPPMRAAGEPEDEAVIEQIRQLDPHLVWVGLGLPKQEYWMRNHAPRLPSALMLGVGAAFDWFAGEQPRAPRYLQAVGLEWAHRVAMEPKRLWPRYRTVVPAALRIFAKEVIRR